MLAITTSFFVSRKCGNNFVSNDDIMYTFESRKSFLTTNDSMNKTSPAAAAAGSADVGETDIST